jgi:hypothetical protein
MKARFLCKMFFPDLKALLCQDHKQNFRSIAHSRKKIEIPKVYFIHRSKLAITGTPIVHPRFLSPQSSVYFANFLKVGLLYHTFGGLTNFYFILTCLCA